MTAQDARERFDAARTAYSEARELGFSRMRSAYEAAREVLLFGVESSVEQTDAEPDRLKIERSPAHEVARMGNRQREREGRQRPESTRDPERTPLRHPSVWDALDEIGRKQESPHDQVETSDAITRIQERTAEQRQESENKEAERQLLASKKQERDIVEQEWGVDFGF